MLYCGGMWEVGGGSVVGGGERWGGVYGNLAIILDHFPRHFQLCNALHALRAVVYVVPMPIVC